MLKPTVAEKESIRGFNRVLKLRVTEAVSISDFKRVLKSNINEITNVAVCQQTADQPISIKIGLKR